MVIMKRFQLLSGLVLLSILTLFQPSARAQMVPSLEVTIGTGGDDLRNGQPIYGAIELRDGRTLSKVNLNDGRGFGGGSNHTLSMRLPAGIQLGDLAAFTLSHDGAPRNVFDSYDNWNLDSIRVATPRVCTPGVTLASRSGRPWTRFTGSLTFQEIALAAPATAVDATPSNIQIAIGTGGDDLRGGQVAYGTLKLRNGRTLPKVSLNGGSKWGNNSNHTVSLPLPAGTRLGDLASLTLEHDGAPRNVFDSYDNWNVDTIGVTTPRTCTESRVLLNRSGRPLVRFTGAKTFERFAF
jgi:hypothetical protein